MRTLCAALLAGAAAAPAAGCAPPDEPDRTGQSAMAGMVVAGIGGARRPVAPEVLPPPPESSPPSESSPPPESLPPLELPPAPKLPPAPLPLPPPPPGRPVQLPPEPRQPPAPPAVISHVVAVQPADVPARSPSAAAETQVGLAELSDRIDDVMGRLDLFIKESMRLQQSLLRLRLRPRRLEPPGLETPALTDLAELPVGL